MRSKPIIAFGYSECSEYSGAHKINLIKTYDIISYDEKLSIDSMKHKCVFERTSSAFNSNWNSEIWKLEKIQMAAIGHKYFTIMFPFNFEMNGNFKQQSADNEMRNNAKLIFRFKKLVRSTGMDGFNGVWRHYERMTYNYIWMNDCRKTTWCLNMNGTTKHAHAYTTASALIIT